MDHAVLVRHQVLVGVLDGVDEVREVVGGQQGVHGVAEESVSVERGLGEIEVFIKDFKLFFEQSRLR